MTQGGDHQTSFVQGVRTYVINLRRRTDRRARMESALPAALGAVFTSDWDGPFDGNALCRSDLARAGYDLFPWRIESDNPWWSRPLKYGEIGCTLSHLAVWRQAFTASADYAVVLEDDAILPDCFRGKLFSALRSLRGAFDLLYLGRYPLEPDRAFSPGVVVPGYSHCTYGYVVTRQALRVLLAQELDKAIVPIDEFLPSLYIDHPRADLRARFPRQLTALALDPPLVRQRCKEEAGSDTEASAFVEDAPSSTANGESSVPDVARATRRLGS